MLHTRSMPLCSVTVGNHAVNLAALTLPRTRRRGQRRPQPAQRARYAGAQQAVWRQRQPRRAAGALRCAVALTALRCGSSCVMQGAGGYLPAPCPWHALCRSCFRLQETSSLHNLHHLTPILCCSAAVGGLLLRAAHGAVAGRVPPAAAGHGLPLLFGGALAGMADVGWGCGRLVRWQARVLVGWDGVWGSEQKQQQEAGALLLLAGGNSWLAGMVAGGGCVGASKVRGWAALSQPNAHWPPP